MGVCVCVCVCVWARAPTHVGSITNPLSLLGCFPANLVTHPSGRIHVFPVKLLSKTNGPINLLSSKPHHTFTENLLSKLVPLVLCGFPWKHVHKFHVFTPSWVKNTSFINKMTVVEDVMLSSSTNSYVE